MELDANEVQAGYYCLAQFVRQRAIAGRGCPPAVTALYRRLDIAIRAHDRNLQTAALSESRHENSSGAEQSESWITAAQAGALLGLSNRHVRRLAADLDGQCIGGRWLFDRNTVQEYARERLQRHSHAGG